MPWDWCRTGALALEGDPTAQGKANALRMPWVREAPPKMPRMDPSLDLFDRKILALVQRDCQMNAEVIAQEVGLSASAVQRRLRRMRSDKVISAEVAVVNPQAVGGVMSFLAGLEVKDNYEALPRIRSWSQGEPGVQQVYYVTGTFDIMMVIVARDVKAYDALAARLMSDIPQITRMTTHVVIDTMKNSLYVPVDTSGDTAASP